MREAWAETLTAEIGCKEADFATSFGLSAAYDDVGSLRKPSLRGSRWEPTSTPGREQMMDGRDALIANPSIWTFYYWNLQIPDGVGVNSFCSSDKINVRNKSAYINYIQERWIIWKKYKEREIELRGTGRGRKLVRRLVVPTINSSTINTWTYSIIRKWKKKYSLRFNIDDVLGDCFCFIIDDVFTYLDNFNFIKNCVANCVFIIFVYN